MKRGLRPIWMLEVLDEAAERGLINDLAERLDDLEHATPFYIGEKVRQVIEGMRQRDLQRKQAQEQDRTTKNRRGPRRSRHPSRTRR